MIRVEIRTFCDRFTEDVRQRCPHPRTLELHQVASAAELDALRAEVWARQLGRCGCGLPRRRSIHALALEQQGQGLEGAEVARAVARGK